MRQAIALTFMAAASSAIALAQDPQERTAQMTAELRAAAETRAQAVVAVRSAVETRITPGRPYSADAVNEFAQVLADGNRISRSSTTKVFRDTEGRTRRETDQSISISDPVAHVSYVLDPVKRTAVKAQIAIAYPPGRGVLADKVTAEQAKVEVERRRETEIRARGGAAPVIVEPVAPAGRGGRGGGARSGGPGGPGESKTDQLGQKMIEGVLADGTRTTTVIPAGAIGNLQPITIVSEQWFSQDLQVLVMTRHSDPRSGESTYRLINISRAEPDRSLFEVPPDYTVKEQRSRLTPVLQDR